MKKTLDFLFAIVLATCVLQITAYPTTNLLFEDKPMRIKKNPRVSADGCDQQSGQIVVRVTFDKTGVVTDVVVVSESECRVFNERAVKAVYALAFEPAKRDGEKITVTKQMEFSFRKY